MTDSSVALSLVSCTGNQSFFSQMAVGSTVLQQQPGRWAYWFVIIDRGSLQVVYNQLHTSANTVPDLSSFDNGDHILAFASIGVGLNNQPQGDLFKFLDMNGTGRELRRVSQLAVQFNCGSLGTFGYALVGIMGEQNLPGFEVSQFSAPATGPILTVQLMPSVIDGKTIYTPVQLSNA